MPSPPRSPTTLNTPRNRALDIGTDKGGFPADAVPLNYEQGVPAASAGGTYSDQQGTPFTPAPGGAAADPKPFK